MADLTYKGFTLKDGEDREVSRDTVKHIYPVSDARLSQLHDSGALRYNKKTGIKVSGGGTVYSLRKVLDYAIAHPIDEKKQRNARKRGKG